MIAAGVGVFLLVGLGLLLLGRPFLGYPPALAGSLILLIESAAMLAIATTLVLAFMGGRPQPAESALINTFATMQQADLIIMGTLGRAGIPGLIIGNTAEDVIQETRTAVLAVKPDGIVSPVA